MILNRLRRSLLALSLLICALGMGSGKTYAQAKYSSAFIYADYVGTSPTDLKYVVTLVVYHRCESGAPVLTSTEKICVYSSCGSLSAQSTLHIRDSAETDPYCPLVVNSCTDPTSTLPGYVRGIYRDTITVTFGACTDLTFEWQSRLPTSYNRDPKVANVNSGFSMDVRASINNVLQYNASTPRYLGISAPLFNLCLNSHDVLPLNPASPDHHTLNTTYQQVYAGNALCGNRKSSGTYTAAGYSGTYPIDAAAGDPFTVDPQTGATSFTPTGNPTSGKFNRYALGFVTTGYDSLSGNLISSTEADIEVDAESAYCSTPPFFDSVPTNTSLGNFVFDTVNGSKNIDVCPGSRIHFDLNAQSASSTGIINIDTIMDAKLGASWFPPVAGRSSGVGTFDWKPTGAQVGYYIVTFRASDLTCASGQNQIAYAYLTIRIHVLPSVQATFDHNYCGPTSDPVHLNVTGPPGATYTWDDTAALGTGATLDDPTISNPTGKPLSKTRYIVTSSATTSCKNADTVYVSVYSPDVIDPGPDQTICKNQSAYLNPSFPKTDTAYWTDVPSGSIVNQGTSSKIANALVHPLVPITTYTLHVWDTAKLCAFHLSDTTHVKTVGTAPLVFLSASPDSVCPGACSQLLAIVQAQSCGGATTTSCTGTSANLNLDAAKSAYWSNYSINSGATDPDIFYIYYYGPNRIQTIYTAAELHAAGIYGGYINNIGYLIKPGSQPLRTSDKFYGFTIKMGCTPNATVNCAAFDPKVLVTVYPGTTLDLSTITAPTTKTFNFTAPYYWDGVSNLLVEMCYSRPYEGTNYGDYASMSTVRTANPQSVFTSNFFPGACCSSTAPGYAGCGASGSGYLACASARPATTFNICQNASKFVYTWTPSTFLNNTNIFNPMACGISTKTLYHLTVYNTDTPGCKTQDSIAVAVDTSTKVKAIPESIILCRPGYQPIGAQAYGLGPIGNLVCGTANPVSCSSPSVATVGNPNSPGSYSNTFFYYYSSLLETIVTSADLKSGGMTSAGTINELDVYISNLYSTYSYNLNIYIACTPKQSYTSNGDTTPISKMTLVYSGTSLTPVLGQNSYVFQKPYSWDTTQNLVIRFCRAYNNNFAQDYLALQGTSYPSTICGDNYSGDACAFGPNFYPIATPQNSRPVITFKYCPAGSVNFNYTWNPGTFLSDSSAQFPTAYVTKSTTYTVSTRGRNNCLLHDSVSIFLPVRGYAIFPVDTAFCQGGSAKLGVKGASKSATFQWYQNGYQKATTLSCTTCANPISKPSNTGSTLIDTTTYQLVITDSVNCSDTVFSRVEVKPIPIVTATIHDTSIDYGSSVQLSASGAAVYTWFPTGTLSNPNIVNPIATPVIPTTYTVRGLAADGCFASDTVHVGINYRGNLFVPTAFTPNGDGKNDRFKVSNLTFERIIEFHVYNRWGQEVFNAADNQGWDGRWNNVSQDIGVYQYLIRVGFPDGFIETFKGDITLLR
ncbi:MAG: gliding motility-associated C-terminal domain-containing protein [Taibaiella sp.]|nr:gliding motility-associated C-terminal domain-containing protein [Taibaiella sp.]